MFVSSNIRYIVSRKSAVRRIFYKRFCFIKTSFYIQILWFSSLLGQKWKLRVKECNKRSGKKDIQAIFRLPDSVWHELNERERESFVLRWNNLPDAPNFFDLPSGSIRPATFVMRQESSGEEFLRRSPVPTPDFNWVRYIHFRRSAWCILPRAHHHVCSRLLFRRYYCVWVVTPLVTRRFIVGPSEIKSAVIPHTMDSRLGKVPRE